jgi:hypothetical protein
VARITDTWLDFNRRLAAAVAETPGMSALDGSRPRDVVERDVREWIEGVMADWRRGPG